MTYSVTAIGDQAFYSSYSTSVILPNSLTYIGKDAFWKCKNLSSIVIPDGVTEIGDYAFSTCESLSSVTIPKSVTTIGESPFHYCSLSSVIVEDGNPVYDSRNDCNAIIETRSNTLITGSNNTVIPEGVTAIADFAFSNRTGLTSITIPGSVKTIGQWAFIRCTSLTSVTIPKSVTTIGYYAFSECNGLISIQVESGNPVYDSREDCNAIIETTSRSLILGCCNTVIPSSVWFIRESAFEGCTGLTSIVIPDNVFAVYTGAFRGCTGLTSIVLPKLLTEICRNVFADCSSLTTVVIPQGVTNIDYGAFRGCSSLTSILIPHSVKSIRNSAFGGCSSLTSITIPNSVNYMEAQVFYNCSSLTSIIVESDNTVFDSRDNCNAIIHTRTNTLIAGCCNTVIPSNVTTIAKSSFEGCTGMTTLIIPDGVQTIEDQAFSHCDGLTKITIPKSVVNIGDWVFSSNTLTDVYCLAESVPTAGSNAFYGVENTMLYVPDASVGNYSGSKPWSNFKAIAGLSTGVAEVSAQSVELLPGEGGKLFVRGLPDGEIVDVYDIHGAKVGSAHSNNGMAVVYTNLASGSMAIVKMRQESVKVMIK